MVFQVLCYLLEQRHRVISKDELCEQVWHKQSISNTAIESTISKVRQAVGDSGKTQGVIQTQYGYGYRFVATVTGAPGDAESLTPALPPSAVSQALPGKAIRDHGVARPLHIGREPELFTLRQGITQLASGQGGWIALVGPPGIGKSRLLEEVQQGLNTSALSYVCVSCLPERRLSPYWVMQQFFRQLWGIAPGENETAVVTKITQILQDMALDTTHDLPYVSHLLEMPTKPQLLARLRPETVKWRLFAFLQEFALTASRRQPLVMAVEDIHWIDPTSADWLTSLSEHLVSAPLLLLTTCRDDSPPGWLAQGRQLHVPPLTPHESRQFITAVTPQPFLESLQQMLVAQADGNPLALLVLTRFIGEYEALMGRADVPDPLAAVIEARLRKLAEPLQHVLHSAAIIGQRFSPGLLQSMWPGTDDVVEHLATLEAQGWCRREAETPGPVYVFTPTGVRDIVYATLPLERRQALHAALAQALEAARHEPGDAVIELLAYHYARTEHVLKALQTVSVCIDNAVAGCAQVEALLLAQQALTQSKALPNAMPESRHLDLLLRQAQALYALGHFQEALTTLQGAQELLEQHQDRQLTGHYALELGRVASRLGAWQDTLRYAQQAVEVATACQDETTMGQAYYLLAMASYWVEQPLQGVAMSQQAMALFQRPEHAYDLGMTAIILALSALLLGDFATALEAVDTATAIGEALTEPHLQSYAAWTRGWLQATQGEWEQGISACQHAIHVAPDPLSAAFACGWQGYGYLEQGEVSAAMPLLERARQTMRQFHYQRFESLYTTFLGEAHLLANCPDKAHDLMQQGLMLAREAQYRFGVAWAQRALSRAFLTAGACATAQLYLEEALAVFTALPAPFEAARTHCLGADIMQRQAQSEVATRHVSSAYRPR